MTEISTAIAIEQTPAVIWNVLMDFANYSEWNPFIVEISGRPSPGDKLKVVLATAPGKTMVFRPRVEIARESDEFVWQGHFVIPGLFDGRHRFKLVAMNQRTTKFEHTESFRGILLPLLRPLLQQTKKNFETMNQALKKRAEQVRT